MPNVIESSLVLVTLLRLEITVLFSGASVCILSSILPKLSIMLWGVSKGFSIFRICEGLFSFVSFDTDFVVCSKVCVSM